MSRPPSIIMRPLRITRRATITRRRITLMWRTATACMRTIMPTRRAFTTPPITRIITKNKPRQAAFILPGNERGGPQGSPRFRSRWPTETAAPGFPDAAVSCLSRYPARCPGPVSPQARCLPFGIAAPSRSAIAAFCCALRSAAGVPVIADPPLRKEKAGDRHPRTWSSQAGPFVVFVEADTLTTPWPVLRPSLTLPDNQ